MDIDKLTGIVVGLCIKIHSRVGPGCYESVYDEILYYELVKAGLQVKRQLVLPVVYEELHINKGYKLDLLVEEQLIIELETKNPLPSVSFDQVRTYLSLLDLKYGMLINFKVSLIKQGIHRVFNNWGRVSL